MKNVLYYQQTTKNNLENIRNSLRTENPCVEMLEHFILSYYINEQTIILSTD